MRSTNVTRGGIRRVCGAMVVSLAVWLGHSPAAEASITVRLQQVDAGGNPVSSVLATDNAQTLVFGRLLVSGSLEAAVPTSSFETVLTWNASVGSNTNLYTVDGGGVASTTSPTAIIFDSLGFLYALGEVPDSLMNVNGGLSVDNQRRVSVGVIGDFPSLPAGEFLDIPIMDIRFAVTQDIDNAAFSFTLAGSDPNGFYDSGFNYGVGFTNGGGTIAVVPEPGTMQACILGIAVVGGNLLRRQVRRRQQGGQSALAALA